MLQRKSLPLKSFFKGEICSSASNYQERIISRYYELFDDFEAVHTLELRWKQFVMREWGLKGDAIEVKEKKTICRKVGRFYKSKWNNKGENTNRNLLKQICFCIIGFFFFSLVK